jgi:DNA-binding XRE family transcriptional regulator
VEVKMPRGKKAVPEQEEEAKKRGRKPGQTASPDRHKEKYIQMGLTVSYYRKLKGLSQEELADLVGCSRGHISGIEAPKMKTSVSLESLFDISDALGIPVGKLFETR